MWATVTVVRSLRRRLSPSLLSLCLSVCAMCTVRADAAEEHELQVGVEALYGVADVDSRTASGAGGAVQVAYGLTDALALHLTAVATGHPLASLPAQMLLGGTLATYGVTAGIVYSLDVVRIVPFFEAGLGLMGTSEVTDQGTSTRLDLGLQLGLGADYLINRRVAVGLAVRYYAFLTDLTSIPLYLVLGPRLTLRFGL